jgi:tetratricopeptide (TPR) repeat protein
MLWTTIATGKDPDTHGVCGFAEVDTDTGKVAPLTPFTRRTPAIWNILSEQGHTCGVIGWMGSHPAEPVRGISISDAFARTSNTRGEPLDLLPGSVHPTALEEEFAELRVRPCDLDPKLLGLFLPRLKEMQLGKGDLVQSLARRLGELYTLHNASIRLLEDGQPAFLTVYYHFLDGVSHQFMQFAPPKLPWIKEHPYTLYHGVMEAAYRVQDILLGDLLRHCRPETRVMIVSDHGFASGSRRPAHTPKVSAGIAAWHRPYGILVAHGPGIRQGSVLHGARLADITPTALALFGLPPDQEMHGRILNELLLDPPELQAISSWDDLVTRPDRPQKPVEGAPDALLQQFADLGYLNANSGTNAEADSAVRISMVWNLGLALHHLGRSEDALPFLYQAYLEEPESPQYAYHLALCQIALGLSEQAECTVETLLDFGEQELRAKLLLAQLALLQRNPKKAANSIEGLPESMNATEEVQRIHRQILLHNRRFPEALTALETAIARGVDTPSTHVGLAHARFKTGDFAGAKDAAQHALRLHHHLPHAEAILEHAQARLEGKPTPDITLPDWSSLIAGAVYRADLAEKLTQDRARWNEELASRRQGMIPIAFMQLPAPPAPFDGIHWVVSGSPRSGTSLMMRMLALSGMPILTDGVRQPDEDNPLGYFEWEKAKDLPRNPACISEAENKVVKIVSPLLRALPKGRRYKVIFMRRELNEILRSQEKMIERRGGVAQPQEVGIADKLGRHIETTVAWGKKAPHIDLLEVHYGELVRNPGPWCDRILTFLGRQHIKRPEAMLQAIRPELYRQRNPVAHV